MRLLPVHIRDWLLREHVETQRYVDPITGEEYAPPELPEFDDPDGEDSGQPMTPPDLYGPFKPQRAPPCGHDSGASPTLRITSTRA
jgi:hypothetical protein